MSDKWIIYPVGAGVKAYRLAWFKGIAWGYLGIWYQANPYSYEYAWTKRKSEAALYTKEDADAMMRRWPTEKLELEEVD
jgi:hypothetical protein